MASHLYRVGEKLTLEPHSGTFYKSSGLCTVRAQLPPLGDQYQYRVRCDAEPYERVVMEYQLSPQASAAQPELIAS